VKCQGLGGGSIWSRIDREEDQYGRSIDTEGVSIRMRIEAEEDAK
jgi:hypothetical protein